MPKRMFVEGVYMHLSINLIKPINELFLQFLDKPLSGIVVNECSQRPNCFMCWDYCSMLFKDRKKKFIATLMCTDDVCVSTVNIHSFLSINHWRLQSIFQLNLSVLFLYFSSPDVNLHATIFSTCWRNQCTERIFSNDSSTFAIFPIDADARYDIEIFTFLFTHRVKRCADFDGKNEVTNFLPVLKAL